MHLSLLFTSSQQYLAKKKKWPLRLKATLVEENRREQSNCFQSTLILKFTYADLQCRAPQVHVFSDYFRSQRPWYSGLPGTKTLCRENRRRHCEFGSRTAVDKMAMVPCLFKTVAKYQFLHSFVSPVLVQSKDISTCNRAVNLFNKIISLQRPIKLSLHQFLWLLKLQFSVQYPVMRMGVFKRFEVATSFYYPGQKKTATTIMHKIRTLFQSWNIEKSSLITLRSSDARSRGKQSHRANLVILRDKNSVWILCIIWWPFFLARVVACRELSDQSW